MSDQTPSPQYPQPQPLAPQAKRKSWFARHKIMSTLGAIVLVIIVANSMSSNSGTSNTGSSNTAAAASGNSGGLTDTADNTVSQPAPAPAKPKHTAPAMTVSQANALRSAQQYLSMEGFSRRGLIQQLSSKMGEGYPKADAKFAVDHMHVDWNQQAVRSGKQYLSMEGFSRSGLIQQLSSKMGEGFTHSQAVYAVNHLGL